MWLRCVKDPLLPGIRIKRCQWLLLNCSGQKRNSLFQDKGIILTLGQRSVSGGSATSIYNPTCLIITGHKPPRRKNMKWNHHFNSFISIKALKFPFNMVRDVIFGVLWLTQFLFHRGKTFVEPTQEKPMSGDFPQRTATFPWESFGIVMFCRHFVLVTHDVLFLLAPNATFNNFEGYGWKANSPKMDGLSTIRHQMLRLFPPASL